MRLRRGSIIIPYEKILVYIENKNILRIVEALTKMLNDNIELYIVLEPAVSKVVVGKEKYFTALSIGSLIIPQQASEALDYLSELSNSLWILDEDVWTKTSKLSANKIYVHGFENSKLLNYFNGLINKVNITNTSIPYISLFENPTIDINIKEKQFVIPDIKLLKPGHIVVNGLREVIMYDDNRKKIPLYTTHIDELNKKPIDILALASNFPLVLERINEKTIIVLIDNWRKYSSAVGDLILYNSVIYMLAS